MRERELAEWLWEELGRDGVLTLDRVVREVLETTGGEYVRINRGGNWSASRVLREAFAKVAGDRAVWDEAHRCWRRTPAGEPEEPRD